MSETTTAPPAIGSFCWNELGTRDGAAAKKFYCEVLGWTAEEMPMGEMGSYTMFKCGDTMVGGMYEMKGEKFEGVPPNWMSYINVEDVDASTRKAESLGATVLVPPTDIPGMGRFSTLLDPTGAPISLWQMKAECS